VPPDLRDTVVDFVRAFSERTERSARWVLERLAVSPTQFYRWAARYGRVNTHNGRTPRDHWLTAAERRAILRYHATHAPEGYRRMTFMMLDADVVAVSPATVYRVLKAAGVLDRWNAKPSLKGTGFVQPLRPHEHWHIDISYLNLAGTFYYLCSIWDGATRFLVHWELRERMTTADVETVIQRARERYPDERPRIISDNGPQFIARDFKEFIRLAGMTHVRAVLSAVEREARALAPNAQGDDDSTEGPELTRRRQAQGRGVRRVLQSPAVAQCDRLRDAGRYARGRAETIWTMRDQKLETARARRRALWQDTSTERRLALTEVY
jgi:putative transposase